jgi:hypothetical protein
MSRKRNRDGLDDNFILDENLSRVRKVNEKKDPSTEAFGGVSVEWYIS